MIQTAAVPHETIYATDTDPVVALELTDLDGGDLDWPSPTVLIDGETTTSASWTGDVGSTRRLLIPWPAGLMTASITHHVLLVVPGGIDRPVAYVTIRASG